MTGLALAVVVVLLLTGAFLTAAESAVFQLSPSRIRTLQQEEFGGAHAVFALHDRPDPTRSGLRIVTTALQLVSMALIGAARPSQWGAPGTVFDLAAAILLILVLTDLLPRAIAGRHPVRLSLVTAPLLLRLARILAVIGAPAHRLEVALGGTDRGELTQEGRELQEMAAIGAEEGVLEAEETLLVERAFRLDELTTWDVMTPRVDVFAWKESLTVAEIVPELPSVPYSRVPVYCDSVDDITGVLYVREVYQAYSDGHGARTLSAIAREPFFVPGSLALSKLLQAFRTRRIHLGIVADEFGGIDGLVTLEDVLEELVGEIVDETDLDEEELVHISSTQVIADGGVELRDVNNTFDLTLPSAEHRTLNGFILEELGYVPPEGERFTRGGVEIEILEASETQVVKARVTRLPDGSPVDVED